MEAHTLESYMLLPTSFDKIFHASQIKRNTSLGPAQLLGLSNQLGKNSRPRSHSFDNTDQNKIDTKSPTRKIVDDEI